MGNKSRHSYQHCAKFKFFIWEKLKYWIVTILQFLRIPEPLDFNDVKTSPIPSPSHAADKWPFYSKDPQVKHFKHGIHRFMWIFDRFTRAANFLENSHFLFAAIPLTPLHVKCSPIEISPRALQFLASVPNIQIYCTAPSTEQRNTTWENCWME